MPRRSGKAPSGRSARKGGRGKGAGPSRRSFLLAGAGAAGTLVVAGGAGRWVAGALNDFPEHDPARLAALRGTATTPLFDRFPGLAAHVPWRPLGAYPTAIETLPSPEGATDVLLFVKREDRSSALYGGNKVRKLEHLLADATLRDSRTIVTAGATGTNHGLATAVHAREFGITTRIATYPQPDGPHVARNRAAMLAAGASLHAEGGEVRALRRARSLYRAAAEAGEKPVFIVFGGSSRLGALGHVAAALELATQVRAGAMPEPDRLFVALGTCGTAAGLVAGCRLAGLRTRVSAVRVTPPFIANAFTVRFMANDVLRFLRAADPAVPRVRIGVDDFDVTGDELGSGYGRSTERGDAATAWAAARGLPLEPTYTAKTLAACLAWCRGRARPGETVLYWHSYAG